MIKIHFLGAAGQVTGSCYVIETSRARVMLECGLYQEWKLKKRNFDPLPIDLSTIGAIVGSHPHIDHIGAFPRRVKQGYTGKLHMTNAGAAITEILLLDSGHIHEQDLKWKMKRHEKERKAKKRGKKHHVPYEVLYTVEDAQSSLPQIQGHKYAEPFIVAPGFEITFFEAGHVLGSAVVKLVIEDNGVKKTIIFSGDLGPLGKPFLRDSWMPERCDFLIMETLYGDENYPDIGDTNALIARIVNSTLRRGGNVVVPVFANGRAQEVPYRLNELILQNEIPAVPIIIDTPMGISINEVYKQYTHLFDPETLAYIDAGNSPLEIPTLIETRSTQASKALNQIKGGTIILAGSGMGNAGRVKHHFVNNNAARHTVMGVGYAAPGTPLRQFYDGKEFVRILGRERKIRFRVEKVPGLGGHKDQTGLLTWATHLSVPPQLTMLTHGELSASNTFSGLLSQNTGWTTVVPEYKQTITLCE